MIKNWVLQSFRRFLKAKSNSFINIFGLTLGMVVFILIFIYVNHEFSYDKFHKESNRIFRLVKENPPNENNFSGRSKQVVLPAPLADVLKNQITGIEHVSRMANWGGVVVVETEGKTFYENSYPAADGDIFQILTFEIIYGNAEKALQQPNTVALSTSTAIKYFGTTDVIGKVLEFTSSRKMGSFVVDLVYDEFPTNSSYHFNLILRFEDFVKANQSADLENWNNNNYSFLVKTAEKINSQDIETQIKHFFINKYEGTAYDEEIKRTNYLLEPLTDIHLKSDVIFSDTTKNDINRLYVLSIIAILVLAVAGINYVNLTTARAVNRAKEVGIRKASGAHQTNLVLQFMVDAFAISLISMIIAVCIVWTIFPSYCDFIGKELPLNLFTDSTLILIIIVIPISLGTIAGIYPSFVLASFKPAKVLKGNFSRSQDGNLLRDGLTVFQFSISGGLIIAVFVIGQQLNFIETHDPGYDREHILRVNLTDEGVRQKKDIFAEELRKYPNIINTSIASYFPNSVYTKQDRIWTGSSGTTDVSFYTTYADYNYIDLFNIKLTQGRNFSPNNPSDKHAFLINETAANVYGWSDPVGMEFTGENDGNAGDTVRIIGVIKDIHITSYQRPIAPFRIGLMNQWSGQIAVKIKPNDIPATLAYIEKTYKAFSTTKLPYSISFFDEDFGKVYKTDRQLGKLINYFSIIAIIIACLGLYGLSVHTVTQRTKEIGIRKILGAEIAQITLMLSRKFIQLVIIAFAVASPIAYYIMNQWLLTYAYHTNFGAGTFILTGGVMILIALVTVGGQTWRAASANPTNTLRTE